MNAELLMVRGVCKSFDGVKALLDFSCSMPQGEVLGLIGPNGAGKTTLFNVVSGFLRPDQGEIAYKGVPITRLAPHEVAKSGIARTFQNLRLIRQISVLDNVLLSFTNQLGEKLVNVFFHWGKSRQHEANNRENALALLHQAGLADKANEPAENLSYGQQKLLSLMCCLASGADLFLLDEPVAGIAPEMMERILALVRNLPKDGKSVILIEHDMGAIWDVCDRVIFMDAGRKVCEGTPNEVRNNPKVIEAYLD